MARAFARIGLRGRILLLTLPAVNLAFVAIWYLATASARQGLVSLSGRNLETAASSLGDAIAQAMTDLRADAAAAARLDITAQAIDSHDSKNFAWFADVLVRSKKRYPAMFVTDGKGLIVAANTVGRDGRPIPALIGRTVTTEAWGRQVLGSKPADVAVPLGRPKFLLDVLAPGEEVAGVSLPVIDVLGDRSGTMTVLVSSAYLGDILARFLTVTGQKKTQQVSAVAIVTSAGRPIVLPGPLAQAPGWRDPRLAGIGATELGSQRNWLGPEGVPFLYTHGRPHAELAELGWQVAAMQTVATVEAPVRRLSGRLLWAFGGGIAVTTLVLIVLATRVVRPIRRLTEAATRTGKASDFEPIACATQDEVGVLTAAFNRMLGALKDNQIGLEGMVAARTTELQGRNRAMRLVLDNVEQGLLTISLSGHLAAESSAIVSEWFGPFASQMRFSDYLRPIDPQFAAMFDLSYEALKDDVLPRELCLDQMPSRLRHGAREVACSYVPILEGDQLLGLLIVMDDVSELVQAALREAERTELVVMFEALTRDRAGFHTFVDEVDELFAGLDRALDRNEVDRIVHTLKGNTQLMGLTAIGDLCHKLEEELSEGAVAASRETSAALEGRWRQLRQSMANLLGDQDRDRIELSVEELDKLAQELRRGLPTHAVLDRIATWQLEPAELALHRLGVAARSIARRLGKGDLVLEIAGHGVLLDPKRWRGLWAEMIHLVRNAVDHGLETPPERQALGKAVTPTLRLTTRREDGHLEIGVADDGRGVDWKAVAAAAVSRDLPATTPAELVAALFHAGLTTKETTTEVSGRGVGLAAIKQRVAALGGTIDVQSTPGQGTTFLVRVPLEPVAVAPAPPGIRV